MRVFFCCLALTAMPGCGPPVPAPTTTARPKARETRENEPAPDQTRGRTAYRRECAACHGLAGRGDGPNARYLGRRPVRLDRPRKHMIDRLMARRERLHVDRNRRRLRDIALYLAQGLEHEPSRSGLRLSGADKPGCDSCHSRSGPDILREANCAGCHDLPGHRRRMVGPVLTGVGSRFQPTFLRRYLRQPYNRRQLGYQPLELTRMPDFNLSDQEAADVAARLDLSRVEFPTRPRPRPELATTGRRLVQSKGCRDCHRIGKRGGRFGPDLTGVGRRLRWPYLLAWMRNPKALSPGTPMPRPELTVDQLLAVASYLWTLKAKSIGDDKPLRAVGNPERGQRLLHQLRCTGCHDFEDLPPPRHRVLLPLERLTERKNWLYDFLDRPPVRRGPTGRMPRFRFTGPERMVLTDTLLELAASPAQRDGRAATAVQQRR